MLLEHVDERGQDVRAFRRLTSRCRRAADRTPRFACRSVDADTKATVQKLPMLTVKAGPRDGDEWIKRVKEEYMALITVRAAAHSSARIDES